jgi:GT2 family glycosyltransferase
MVVDNNKLKEIDFFDENTFLYAEEPILSEKLIKKGYKTAYYNGVRIRHLHGFSTKTFGNLKRFQLNLSSDLYYFSKYRNFSKTRLFLIKFAGYIHFFCWAPVIRLIKSLNK